MDIIQIIETIVQNSFFLKYGLAGLFVNGLLSSVIPIPTELTTSALIAGGENKLSVFTILALSSILGGILAYYLGRSGNKLFKYFFKNPKMQDEQKSHDLLSKYGWLAIFLCSWIPILGDIIPIVAGTKKYNFTKFLIAMSAGKLIKVIAIVYISGLVTSKFFHAG